MTSESDDNLHDALARNGAFDSEKAATLRRDTVAAFSRRLRNVERLTWVYVIGLSALAVFSALRLLAGSDTKELILFGILLLIALEKLTLMKLWYWLMNNKLSVLKELKELRSDMPLVAPSVPSIAGHGEKLSDTRPETRGCSKRERTVWYVVLFAAVILVAVFVQGRELLREGMTSEGYVTLQPDGSGTVVTRVSYVHYDAVPLTSFSFYCGGPRQNVRWIDGRGREMPATVSEENGQTRYRVRLIEPVMPGEPVQYTRITESASIATKEGDLWVFRQDLQHGFPANRYSDTVLLPPEAELVSASPEPSQQFQRDRSAVLRFQESVARQEHFRYTIQYGLPTQTDRR